MESHSGVVGAGRALAEMRKHGCARCGGRVNGSAGPVRPGLPSPGRCGSDGVPGEVRRHSVSKFLVGVVGVQAVPRVDQVGFAASGPDEQPRLSIENETVDVCPGAELVARSVMEHELSPG